MAKYRITGPDGSNYEITAPAGMNEQEIIAYAQQQFDAQPQKQENSNSNPLIDAVRSIPGGLAQGAAAIGGLPGDVQRLAEGGFGYALDKITGQNKRGDVRQSLDNLPGQLPTSQDVNATISRPTGGYYEPQTKAGEYAETISSFAPAALAPGSALARAARVVVPGAASETGGQLTKGTSYEPFARAGGALAGGLAVGLGEAALSRGGPKPPTRKELSASADAAYKASERAGVIVKGNSFNKMAQSVAAKVDDMGIDPTLHPRATAALNRVIKSEGDLTLKKVETLRRVVNNAASSPDPSERKMAYVIRDAIDDYVDNLSADDLIAGDKVAGTKSLNEARTLWARKSKSDVIERAIQKADETKGQFSQAGYENALRREFRKIVRNEKAIRRFNDAERKAIIRVANGDLTANTLRYIGKMAPNSAIPINAILTGATVGTLAAGPTVGAIAGAGMGAAGILGKLGATAATSRNARLAAELVRGGQQAAPSAVNSKLLADLLLSQAVNR